ncbi:hypothetical protein KY308_02510 [Candidatus Woesearchaeota archaeon]|nr:hypothetical protein [Candidatus Woesearchaeota archaeon]
MNQEHLGPKSLKNILSALVRAQRKISDKKKTKAQLSSHIENIKEASMRTTKKSVILDELHQLELKVNDLVEKNTEEKEKLRKLQEKYGVEKPVQPVKTLDDFEKISWKLGDNVQKLKKIEKEEKPKIEIVKIDRSKQEQLREIEGQLKLLEARHAKLKKSKKYKASDLKRLEDMIKKYKKTVHEIKSSNRKV